MTATDNLPAIPEWEVPGMYAGESWDSLTSQADEVFGADLETAESLIGIPHIIILATFRLGDYQRPDLKIPADYVSFDIVTAPDEDIARARMRGKVSNDSHVMGGEHLVWNASGTGAYRQFVSYLEARKLIVLPDGPTGGEFGASRLDTPVGHWNIVTTITPQLDADGNYQSVAFPVRLRCPRGLRKSEYANDKSREGITYYLA